MEFFSLFWKASNSYFHISSLFNYHWSANSYYHGVSLIHISASVQKNLQIYKTFMLWGWKALWFMLWLGLKEIMRFLLESNMKAYAFEWSIRMKAYFFESSVWNNINFHKAFKNTEENTFYEIGRPLICLNIYLACVRLQKNFSSLK